MAISCQIWPPSRKVSQHERLRHRRFPALLLPRPPEFQPRRRSSREQVISNAKIHVVIFKKRWLFILEMKTTEKTIGSEMTRISGTACTGKISLFECIFLCSDAPAISCDRRVRIPPFLDFVLVPDSLPSSAASVISIMAVNILTKVLGEILPTSLLFLFLDGMNLY